MIGMLGEEKLDNLMQKWRTACEVEWEGKLAGTWYQQNVLRNVGRNHPMFQQNVESCINIKYRNWLKINKPAEYKERTETGKWEMPVGGNDKDKEKEKLWAKRLWMFAGVTVGLFVLVGSVSLVASRRKR